MKRYRSLAAELGRIYPEYFFITPTGVPDPEQQIRELRLFAKAVMPHFHD